MQNKEIHIPAIQSRGREIFRRFGQINDFRQAGVFLHNQKEYVVKTYRRVFGEASWRKMRRAKVGSDTAAKYLPVLDTLFVYARDENNRKIITRIQEKQEKRLCDLSAEEWRNQDIQLQLCAIAFSLKTMLHHEGWIPEPFGHPAQWRDIPYWPSVRNSTNIMVNKEGKLVVIDVNAPQLWSRKTNPLGALCLWITFRRINQV